MRAYEAQHSNHQIKNSPISSGACFAKFNARQSFPLYGSSIHAHHLVSLTLQVGIVDLDICGPSVPKLLGVEGQSVVSSQYGWVPIRYVYVTNTLTLIGLTMGTR